MRITQALFNKYKIKVYLSNYNIDQIFITNLLLHKLFIQI
jgi:hypothetical protein